MADRPKSIDSEDATNSMITDRQDGEHTYHANIDMMMKTGAPNTEIPKTPPSSSQHPKQKDTNEQRPNYGRRHI